MPAPTKSPILNAAIKEYNEQRKKYTLESDIEQDNEHPYRLGDAARKILMQSPSMPKGWEKDSWKSLIAKPLEKRKAIAGAFVLAQIEVMQSKLD